jgi:predicted RNA-binding Zn-ribbon protein involved in translation (DUF1610 family)
MPLESLSAHACPRCGTASIACAPEQGAVDDAAMQRFQHRIRELTSAAWDHGQTVRGPDGTLLWTSLLVWVGLVSYSWTTGAYGSVGLVTWVILLAGLLGSGAWADRRAARKRGWVDPMTRAKDVASKVLAREAFAARASRVARFGTRLCPQCGHRFEVAVPDEATPA